MRPAWTGAILFSFFSLISFSIAMAQFSPFLRENKQSASDLEVGGDLALLPSGSTRYLTRDDLLSMPQVSFTVKDDPNFTGPTKVRGVALEELTRRLAESPASDTVLAICDDKYLAPYSPGYIAAHHPVLVLEVNGQPPAGWPKAAEDHSSDMGPYMISNPKFTPSLKSLSHTDEAQIPWGVVRLEIRDYKRLLGAIFPRGPWPRADDSAVLNGLSIAEQNCFRCHNAGREGGQKSGVSWESLGAMATAKPMEFAAYVRTPQAKNPQAQMPGNPRYDDATLKALTSYFQTFSKTASKPIQEPPKP